MRRLFLCIIAALIALPSGCSRQEAPAVMFVERPQTLDPAFALDQGSVTLLSLITEPLVRLDNGQPVPGGAASWEVSDDGLEYRFHLRQDLTFPRGGPVEAADYARALHRSLHLTRMSGTGKSTAAPHYLWAIEGAREVLSGDAEKARGIETEGSAVLKIRLAEPDPWFLHRMAHPLTSAIDSSHIDPLAPIVVDELPGEFPWPAGAGPYALMAIAPSAALLEGRNAARGWPRLIEVRWITSQERAESLFRRGRADYLRVFPPPPDGAIKKGPDRVLVLFLNPTHCPPLKDEETRKRLLALVDPSTLAGDGEYEPIPSGRAPNRAEPPPDLESLVIASGDDHGRAVAERLARQLRSAGVDARTISYSWGLFEKGPGEVPAGAVIAALAVPPWLPLEAFLSDLPRLLEGSPEMILPLLAGSRHYLISEKMSELAPLIP